MLQIFFSVWSLRGRVFNAAKIVKNNSKIKW
jgi:hypothetical protein